MSQLVEFLPVLVFFLVYQWTDMVTATMALMASMSLFCLMEWMVRRKLTRARLLALVLVLLFGSATVLTRNALFIQWKPTILQWILAVAFLGSHVVGGGKVLIRRLMENNVTLPDAIWIRLNLAWVVFFLLSGAMNLYVAWSFSEEIWVRFKLFGLMGLTIIFALLQGAYMIRHAQENKPGE
ncbi:MAG: septation protein IspZ [Nitrospirae bacterium]|nr:septation protein IspZ [Magnetococcales bacterium]HAT50295.1 septation protein IspZ [Alphaproteobacteria bacterium]